MDAHQETLHTMCALHPYLHLLIIRVGADHTGGCYVIHSDVLCGLIAPRDGVTGVKNLCVLEQALSWQSFHVLLPDCCMLSISVSTNQAG